MTEKSHLHLVQPPDSLKGDPTGNRNRKLRRAGVAAVGAAALTVAVYAHGGGGSSAKNANTAPVAAAPATIPETTTTTLSPEALKAKAEAEARAYAESPERNKQFDDAVEIYGTRIAKAITAGKFGPYDAYNINTGHYRSHQKDAGWSYLSHSPAYGGSKALIEVLVWQNANGTYDLSKGIHGLDVHVEGQRFASFEAPDQPTLSNEHFPANTGWQVAVDRVNPADKKDPYDFSSPFYAYDHTADQLRAIDLDALNVLDQSMAILDPGDK